MGLASNPIGAHAAHTTFDQTRPHAAVDRSRLVASDNHRSERTRRRRQFDLIVLERDDRDLEAEPPESITDPLQPGPDASRLFQTGCGSQLAAKILACLAERLGAAARGNLLHQEADHLSQTPIRELDPIEFRCDAVHLGRTSGARPTPAAPTLERDHEKSGFRQAIEAVARDILMNAERDRDLVDAKRVASAARVQKNPAKLRVAGRCEAVKRHRARTLPAERTCERRTWPSWSTTRGGEGRKRET
jgi:hypothetical protein